MIYLYLWAAVVIVLAVAYFWATPDRMAQVMKKLMAWRSRLYLQKTLQGQAGFAIIESLITILLGVILVYNFAPMFESNADTTNITNPTTKSFGDLGSWIIPVLAFLGLIFMGYRTFFKGKAKGAG